MYPKKSIQAKNIFVKTQRQSEMPIFNFALWIFPDQINLLHIFSVCLVFSFENGKCISFVCPKSNIYCFTLPIITQKSMASGDNKIHQHGDLCPRTRMHCAKNGRR